VRPHDAAGLVLIRDGRHGPEVLMGRRHAAHSFMPSVFVFPGGRLDPADRQPSGFAEPLAAPPPGIDQATRRRLASFARAALRETFEETGLLLGQPPAGPNRQAPALAGRSAQPIWRAFAGAGLVPAFGALTLVARAITPRRSPKRFHSRFFLADGAAAPVVLGGSLRGSGELDELNWFPVTEVPRLPLPEEITELILAEALAHREAARRNPGAARQAALFRWVGRGERTYHRADPRPSTGLQA
jgi:8-oxo-dGTP pyrophosphatase MutT (NUDIX family)